MNYDVNDSTNRRKWSLHKSLFENELKNEISWAIWRQGFATVCQIQGQMVHKPQFLTCWLTKKLLISQNYSFSHNLEKFEFYGEKPVRFYCDISNCLHSSISNERLTRNIYRIDKEILSHFPNLLKTLGILNQ